MTPKNNKAAAGHDDISGLFARLGTQASEGYQDFAHTQLPPRKPGVTQTTRAAVVEQTHVGQLDGPAPQPVDRQPQTPLESLFQRLLQADVPSSAQRPRKRPRSR